MEDTNPYIYKVLEQLQIDELLCEDSFVFINICLEGILRELSRLYQINQINQNLQDAVGKLLGKELLKKVLNEANKAVDKFRKFLKQLSIKQLSTNPPSTKQLSTKQSPTRPPSTRQPPTRQSPTNNFERMQTRSSCSGLTFLTLVTENALKKLGYTVCSDYFIIFITSILEYLTAEIIDLSGNDSRDKGNLIITPVDIINAINKNEDLLIMFNKIFSTEGNDWTLYFINYTSPANTPIKQAGLLTVFKSKYGTVGINNEFFFDNSKAIENELIQLEQDKIEFESSYLENKEEILNKEMINLLEEDNQFIDRRKETFTFTKSELRERDQKIIDDYIKSQEHHFEHKKKF